MGKSDSEDPCGERRMCEYLKTSQEPFRLWLCQRSEGLDAAPAVGEEVGVGSGNGLTFPPFLLH